MSIFRRKAAPDIYTFAHVSKNNETASSIQHHVELLRYMADHPKLTKSDLISYLNMAESYGMGPGQKTIDETRAAPMTSEQASQVRWRLAETHLLALTALIKELGAVSTPTVETVKMLEFAVNESQKTQGAFT